MFRNNVIALISVFILILSGVHVIAQGDEQIMDFKIITQQSESLSITYDDAEESFAYTFTFSNYQLTLRTLNLKMR